MLVNIRYPTAVKVLNTGVSRELWCYESLRAEGLHCEADDHNPAGAWLVIGT